VGLHYKPFSTVFEKPAFMARDLAPKESSFRRNSRPNCESWANLDAQTAWLGVKTEFQADFAAKLLPSAAIIGILDREWTLGQKL
ncbi:MAG: hypothetical protein AB1898_32205, partial [Acidobacteriota bacterium]